LGDLAAIRLSPSGTENLHPGPAILSADRAAGILPLAKVRWRRAARWRRLARRGAGRAIMAEVLQCHVFARPDFAMGGPHGGAPRGPIAGGLHGGTAFRDGWTAWRRRASRNPAAPRNAVSPWETGAPRSAASQWEAAANPWLGAIARCSRTGSSNPSPSSGESANSRSLCSAACKPASCRVPVPRRDLSVRHADSGRAARRPFRESAGTNISTITDTTATPRGLRGTDGSNSASSCSESSELRTRARSMAQARHS
jgi:hypothetical protein